MRFNWVRLGLASCALLTLAGPAAAQFEGPDVSPSIVKALTQKLRPADLALPVANLRAKLNAIGGDKNLFRVATDRTISDRPEVPMPGLSKVEGSASEVVAVLEPTKATEAPRLAYWIGLIGGHVAARAIPRNSDSMIGPVYGVWRRQGKSLVGVGYDAVYHSPKWNEAEIYAFTGTEKGPKMVQRLEIEGDGLPFGFVNKTSLTLDCRQSAKDGYQTIDGGRHPQSPTCETFWEFQNGRYAVTHTIPIHDEYWAIDRLMTAVAKKRQAVLKEMIPAGGNRKVFLKRLQEAIAHEATHIDDFGDSTLVSQTHPGYGITIEMKETKSGWILRNVTTDHTQ